MNAKKILELSMAAQQMGPLMLDAMGKHAGLEFVQMGNHVVFRPSVLTGHAGYRVYRGPEQRPWWWKAPGKAFPDHRPRMAGNRDPIFASRK